jgi:hypothetical protein
MCFGDDLLDLDDEDMAIIERELFINAKANKLQLGPDPDACYQVLHNLDLQQIIDFIDERNPSAKAPYHGAKHIAAVVSLVYEAARFHNLNERFTKDLVVAAAMHDFNHSGGASSDQQNIKAAIEGLNTIRMDQHNWLSVDFSHVKQLIEVTEYPYVRKATTLFEHIMRDADLMMPYLPDPLRLELFLGLLAEHNNNRSLQMTRVEFAANVQKFYTGVVWFTDWAKAKARKCDWHQQLEALNKSLLNPTKCHQKVQYAVKA